MAKVITASRLLKLYISFRYWCFVSRSRADIWWWWCLCIYIADYTLSPPKISLTAFTISPFIYIIADGRGRRWWRLIVTHTMSWWILILMFAGQPTSWWWCLIYFEASRPLATPHLSAEDFEICSRAAAYMHCRFRLHISFLRFTSRRRQLSHSSLLICASHSRCYFKSAKYLISAILRHTFNTERYAIWCYQLVGLNAELSTSRRYRLFGRIVL